MRLFARGDLTRLGRITWLWYLSMRRRNLEEKEDDRNSDGPKGNVDIEAPSPCGVGGEGAAEERTGDGGDAEDGPE